MSTEMPRLHTSNDKSPPDMYSDEKDSLLEHGKAPSPLPPPKVDPKVLMYKGLFSFFGLQLSYLTWGMMQELIMTTKFNPTASSPDGMFPSASFCVFSNRFLAIIISFIVIKRVHGTIYCSAPYYAFLPCAISNTTSSWAQYASLHYVSFPMQNIFKSTKVIPVMLMGMLLRGVSYSLTEYVEATAITSGVLLFSMSKNATHDNDEETSLIGILLLLTYVCSDSFTSQWQSRIYKDYGKIDQYHMMFWVNTWAVMLTLGALVFSGEIFTVTEFLLVNPTALIYNIVTAITSATGQFFIFYTIKEFGPIVFTVIMTTRQMLSMVLSSVFFGHKMSIYSYLGATLVFGAVFYSVRRQMNKHGKQVLVRHGESEGNVAFNRSRAGDHSLYSGEFLRRHSSQWRLTDVGREQAKCAGQYLREVLELQLQLDEHQLFDRHYTSEYVRAQETAARLDFPGARWFSEVFLRERDWGQMDLMSWAERVEKMGSELQRKELDRFLFAPPGGESMADVAFRANTTLRQLHRECADRRVIIVCHGEVMWAMRTQIERMSIRRYRDLSSSRRVTDRIHNGQILWYTRRDPDTGNVSQYFTHFMSVCPWDLSRSINQWEKIERSIYSNEMLLAVAEQIPRLINHSDSSGAGGEGNKESDDAGPPPSFADADGLSASGGDYDVSLKDVAALHIRPGAAEPQIAVEYPEMMMLDQGSPLDIKNALIVDKTTRYEMERAHYNCEGEELKRELTLRGMVYENIKRSFNAHVLARDNIVSSLTRSGINVTVVKAAKLESIDLSGFHIIMTAGGDGTFLRAAQASSNGVPVLGVNTDPALSQGSLTCCRLDMTGGRHPEFDRIIDRLRSGDFRWMNHDRLIVRIVNAEGNETILPQYVLNEVLVAVRDPAKPSVFDIGIDDLEREKVRCSGLVVCTGTGSTAWYDSITHVHADTVESVLRESNVAYDAAIVGETLQRLGRGRHFGAASGDLAYAVREPIVNEVMGCKRRSARGKRLSVRSLSWNGQLNLDGVTDYPFNFGVQAVIEVGPPDTRLRSFRFDKLTLRSKHEWT